MADAGPFGAASVVVFGLVAAAAWGAADFGGGLTSRRAPVFGVMLASQLVGMALALALAAARGEPVPAPADLAFAAVAGVLGGAGLLALYAGLATGRMGVVAPVTGTLAATVPVLAGIVLEGLPPTLVLAGIALAIVAVVLVSRVAGDGEGRSGLKLAVFAGVALGLFTVVITRVDEALVFAPLTVVRAASLVTVGLVVVATRPAVRIDRRVLPAVVVIGILDMTGNAGLLLAEQTGSLAVAGVLSSLYPVTTVILATIVLRERMGRSHLVGVGLAVVAILLISVGGAAQPG